MLGYARRRNTRARLPPNPSTLFRPPPSPCTCCSPLHPKNPDTPLLSPLAFFLPTSFFCLFPHPCLKKKPATLPRISSSLLLVFGASDSVFILVQGCPPRPVLLVQLQTAHPLQLHVDGEGVRCRSGVHRRVRCSDRTSRRVVLHRS